jgi:hypothetical protein
MSPAILNLEIIVIKGRCLADGQLENVRLLNNFLLRRRAELTKQ